MMKDHLQAICDKFSDYGDAASSESLPAHFDDLNNRRIASEEATRKLAELLRIEHRCAEAYIYTGGFREGHKDDCEVCPILRQCGLNPEYEGDWE